LDGPLRGRHPAWIAAISSRCENATAPSVRRSWTTALPGVRRLAIIATGTLTGLVVGGLVVLLMGAPRATGSGENPAVWIFGLPGFLAIAGTVIGWVAAGLASVEVVDAPVRQRRFRRAGRAATAEQGQLPRSDVPPRYASVPRERHSSR
jgi:hypothetical protein